MSDGFSNYSQSVRVGGSYPHHSQESVQQVNSQNKGLCGVVKEARQTPEILHFGVSTLGGDPAVPLGSETRRNSGFPRK